MIKRNISIKRKNSKIYATRSCQIIFFYILTTLIISIWSIKYEYCIFNSKYSYITLKVAALKDIKIFSSYTYPDEIYINGIKQNVINYSYYFNLSDNLVELIWNNTIKSLQIMFCGCTDITEIDFEEFDTPQIDFTKYISF